MVKGFHRFWLGFIKLVAILIIVTSFINAQSGQKYIGRTLDNSTITTADIQDSSITLSKNKWLNAYRFTGNPTNTYAQQKEIVFALDRGLSIYSGGGYDSIGVNFSSGGGGTGDVNQNGNTFGATMTVGTNDNNTFNFETNNVNRVSISSGATTGGIITFNPKSTNTNTMADVFSIAHTTTGTVASNFGSAIRYTLPSSTGVIRDAGHIGHYWTSASNSNEASAFKIGLRASGTVSDYLSLTTINSGTLNLGSSNSVTFTRSGITASQPYVISTTSTNNITMSAGGAYDWNAIKLSASGNGSAVAIDRGTITDADPASHPTLLITGTISATGAGSNIYEGIRIVNTFNESGGHTGKYAGIFIQNSMSNSGSDSRSIELANATGHGIYQSSTTLKNKFAGNTHFGSTSDAIVKLQVTAGRYTGAKGADIAIANNITLGMDGNMFFINNTGSLYTISSANWVAESTVTLKFTNTATVFHNTAGTGARILLASDINYGVRAGSMLTIQYDGTNWIELSRKY